MDDELDRIRERKREQLRERAEREQQLAASPEEPLEVTGAGHFEQVLENYPVVLVDFYADWCGPCQMLAPILETVAAETAATVAKVDTDSHQRLAQQHGVQGLPTLVVFVDGEPVERLVGMQDETTLRNVIAEHDPASD
ncbi:thioredoxin [Natrialbaceae archaeon AArc-T1-2]|uniref:thioredoxin n=1 Tax=Natrialbaceae archaeon AArc-T1-2 TaxID=3053904 RepID=UPI00255A96A5|nr:thioredoxin [Natrialbaceae archaeon AArc-T1-2]WIV66322.1 thioredoxin [Natrialbaceae archaeon AArc-T1-2]